MHSILTTSDQVTLLFLFFLFSIVFMPINTEIKGNIVDCSLQREKTNLFHWQRQKRQLFK